MKTKHLTLNPYQTKKLAEALAKKILKQAPRKKAVVLALHGELGAGKTTFLQELAKGLGIKEKILSPTFVLMKKFKIYNSPKGSKLPTGQVRFKNFYHFDCYRIKNSKEILNLDFKEIASKPENIIAIEWPKRIENILPKNCVKIKFEIKDKTKRKITFSDF